MTEEEEEEEEEEDITVEDDEELDDEEDTTEEEETDEIVAEESMDEDENEEEDEYEEEYVGDEYDEEYEKTEDDEDDEFPDNEERAIEERARYEELYEDVPEEDKIDYELQDDEDPNYKLQKEMVEKNMAKTKLLVKEKEEREAKWRDLVAQMEADESNSGNTTAEWSDTLDKKMESIMMDPDNVYTAEQTEDLNTTFLKTLEDVAQEQEMLRIQEREMLRSELDVNPQGDNYERIENLNSEPFDFLNATIMKALSGSAEEHRMIDESLDEAHRLREANRIEMLGAEDNYDYLPNETLKEIEECMIEMTVGSYNVTRWLVYDIDFNVTNLMLAATKHNPKAPIIYEHWFPQLQVYKRYQYARDKDFGFTWEDVQNADMKELELYYKGFGYPEIPKKRPGETGIISLSELDEDEMRMGRFASWIQEVYNPEWDRKDFDDDKMKNSDNVFSDEFQMPQHPDLPTYEDAHEDIRNWKGEIRELHEGELTEEQEQYRDTVGKEHEYTVIQDEEFDKEFRGHLIIACTDDDKDLEIAEKITLGCEKEFGKQVYVETRVLEDATEEDYVFEVWLESYNIDLLHSKKRATIGYKGKEWDGKKECDDEEVDRIIKEVGYLISDLSRYSYRLDMEHLYS
eukprot:CAMPEP_0194174068 /NCGR_PEP_ID=MMETSP0154-20130528/8331_1 /TAXON_ID=1049557 /ORGANISM="Thalassiothrix antarctica, Strain L6-D1" /LENGTH=629 /DNA_ID=CAMNT_0038887383 /DNA_START=363 /DNA_END=2252 /DNA_ORIENTATION=+